MVPKHGISPQTIQRSADAERQSACAIARDYSLHGIHIAGSDDRITEFRGAELAGEPGSGLSALRRIRRGHFSRRSVWKPDAWSRARRDFTQSRARQEAEWETAS